MGTLRCTQKLLRQIRVLPPLDDAEPANRLGDWYANALNIGRVRLVLCVSERSLLPVILPAREYRTLAIRLVPEVRWILEQLGVSSEAAASEVAAMEPMTIGKTRSRAVLGSMNEMMFEAYHLMAAPRGVTDLRATSLRLSTSIYSQLAYGEWKYAAPCKATLRGLCGDMESAPKGPDLRRP